MKKSSFLEGAMIATVAIVICKIIGLIYVIPFYSIIGDQGGALYGYAYSIYAIFLSLSTSGIPIAISKIVSEYNALEYYNTKERAYKVGLKIISLLGGFFFAILMIFATPIAHMILGNLEGGNTVSGVALVIRIISTTLLIVPVLSVTKGYLQGHNFIAPSSISNVIEQVVRVLVIVLGSFLALKVFNTSLEIAVSIAVFGATIGAVTAYLYLRKKIKKNHLHQSVPVTRAEAKITEKDIVKKIIFYALPFVMIDLINSAYGTVDTATVVSTMVKLGFNNIAETTIGVLTTWGTKLNMIIISISLGITVSLIPSIAKSNIKKDMSDVSKKINQTLQALLIICLPMTVGLSFLAQPVWVSFYSYNETSIAIFSIYIFASLSYSFYMILINTAQTLNDTKLALGTILVSFTGKVLLNIPMMYLCQKIGIAVYYGPVITTLLTQALSIIFVLVKLSTKYHIHYTSTLYNGLKIVLSTLIMIVVLKITNLFIPIDSLTRKGALLEIFIYAIVGGLTYIGLIYKSGLITDIFGINFLKNITKKIPFIKR
ncbi:MAG: polysaccharide biosynthesis protein [Bacilli bacterium]|nr:polysaccharide biosynthesis protein [Bacilli bacterium]